MKKVQTFGQTVCYALKILINNDLHLPFSLKPEKNRINNRV